MRLRFKVFGGLTDRFAALIEQEWFEFEPGSTLGDFLNKHDFPPKAFWIATVNKTVVHDNYQLKDGDTIEVFPPIAGG